MSSMMADLRGQLSPAHPDVGRYTKVAPSDTSQPSSAIGAAAVSLFLRAVQSLKKLVLWVSTRTHMLQVPWDRAAAERVAAAAVVAEQARGNAHGTRQWAAVEQAGQRRQTPSRASTGAPSRRPAGASPAPSAAFGGTAFSVTSPTAAELPVGSSFTNCTFDGCTFELDPPQEPDAALPADLLGPWLEAAGLPVRLAEPLAAQGIAVATDLAELSTQVCARAGSRIHRAESGCAERRGVAVGGQELATLSASIPEVGLRARLRRAARLLQAEPTGGSAPVVAARTAPAAAGSRNAASGGHGQAPPPKASPVLAPRQATRELSARGRVREIEGSFSADNPEDGATPVALGPSKIGALVAKSERKQDEMMEGLMAQNEALVAEVGRQRVNLQALQTKLRRQTRKKEEAREDLASAVAEGQV
jgi:hypothetical protein